MIVSPLRVYINVSWKGDLENERRNVERLIKSNLLMIPVYPKQASSRDVPSDYFKKINECDILVAILGSKYSPHVCNEINHALSSKIPVLCFTKQCKKNKELKDEISKLQDNRVVTKSFKTIKELTREVREAIISLLCEKFKDYLEIEKALLKLISDGRIETIKPKPFQTEYRDVRRINPFEEK